jgi:GH24 family phage-related lysozyme (muramidase)
MPTPDDVPTIAWGSTLGVKMGDEITIDEAEAFFDRDLREVERCVNNCDLDLSQPQFDACVSLCFNIGCHAFKSSTLVRLLKDHQYKAAAQQFLRWDKQAGKVLRGLSRRREAERLTFLS